MKPFYQHLMPRRASLMALLFTVSLGGSLCTASAAEGIPEGPHLKRNEGPMRWVVRYLDRKMAASSEEEAKGSRRMKEVRVTYTPPSRVVTFVYDNGNRNELWSLNDTFVENLPTSGGYGFVAADSPIDNGWLGYDKSDYPDFRWVSAETYVETVDLEGRRCHLYRTAEKGGEAGDALSSEPSVPISAWIDAQSRLPVRWQQGNRILQVIMEPTPSSPVSIPAPVMELIKQMQRLKVISTMKAPKGG